MSHPRVGPAPPPAQRADFLLYWHGLYLDDKRYWRRDLVNYQGLLWRLVTATEKGVAPPTLATTKVPHWEFVARADPSLGGGGGSMTGAEIEGVLDAYYGDTLWRDPVLPTNLSVTNKTGTTYDVASSTGTDATLPAATDTEAGLFTAANKVKLDGIEASADANVGTDLAITNHNNTGFDLESSTGNDVHLGLATSAGGTNKAGLMSPDQYDKLNGIEAGAEVNDPTNLSIANKTSTTLDVASSTGSDATVPAATGTEAGLMTAAQFTKLAGIEAGAQVNVGTDLSLANRDGDSWDILSSTGTDVSLLSATTSDAGLMSAADKTKLNGIESGATADQTGAEMVAAIDTELGSTDWRTPGGGSGANLAVANNDADSLDITSDSGTDATLTLATSAGGTNLAGLMSPAQVDKLAGIEAGAQVNVGTDLSIANHDADGLDILSSTGNDISLGLATGLAGGNEAGLMAPAQVDLLDSFTTFGETIVAAADAEAGRNALLLRKQLSSDTTFYVRTGGSDTPTREALVDDDAHAWQTLQFAYDYLTRYVDPAGHSMTVQVQDGTYAGGLQANSHWWGGTGIIFQGNVASPENCIINGGSNCAFRADYAQIAVKGFTVKSTSQDGLLAIGMGKIDVTGAMKFDDCAGAHMSSMLGGLIHNVADYEVIGDAFVHISADGGQIRLDISTATFTGTPVFTAFAIGSNGGRHFLAGPTGTGINWSGAVTATYKAILNGGASIFTNNQGINDLPGSASPLIQGSATYDDIGHAATDAIAALTPAADKFPYFTSSSAAALATVTSFARTFLDDTDGAGVRTTIGAAKDSVTGTASATTSGTSVTISSLPTGIKQITLTFSSVSTNGSSNLRVRLGAGSVATSGYKTSCLSASTSAAAALTAVTDAFIIGTNSGATAVFCGSITFTHHGGNVWVGQGVIIDSNGNRALCPGGLVSLGGTLDRIQLTTVNGTDTFDAGEINVFYQ